MAISNSSMRGPNRVLFGQLKYTRPHISSILKDVTDERLSQVTEWGIQNHPMHRDEEAVEGYQNFLAAIRRSEAYARETDTLDWALILLEEVYEALTAETYEEQRAELIQVAAVAVAAIEALDRENGVL